MGKRSTEILSHAIFTISNIIASSKTNVCFLSMSVSLCVHLRKVAKYEVYSDDPY